MLSTPILALADKASTSVMDALPHLAGMAMVMATLTILWGVCALTAKLIHIFRPEPSRAAALQAKPAAKPAVPYQPAAPAAPAAIAPEILAVIAAAVATATGNQPVRIVSIKPMSTSWERAGRQSVLTSHRIR